MFEFIIFYLHLVFWALFIYRGSSILGLSESPQNQTVLATSIPEGTNLSLTITTWPRLLVDFHFDCVIGPRRVPAKLLQAGTHGNKNYNRLETRGVNT